MDDVAVNKIMVGINGALSNVQGIAVMLEQVGPIEFLWTSIFDRMSNSLGVAENHHEDLVEYIGPHYDGPFKYDFKDIETEMYNLRCLIKSKRDEFVSDEETTEIVDSIVAMYRSIFEIIISILDERRDGTCTVIH